MKNKKDSDNKKNGRTGMSRREFIGTSLTAATAFAIVPSHVLGGNGKRPPSDKLNIAAIGIGKMGWNDVNNDALKNENMVALCDVNEENLKRASEEFPGAKTYIDWRKCLENKDIDAV